LLPETSALVAGIGVEFAKKWEELEQRRHQQHAAVAVLQIGAVQPRLLCPQAPRGKTPSTGDHRPRTVCQGVGPVVI